MEVTTARAALVLTVLLVGPAPGLGAPPGALQAVAAGPAVADGRTAVPVRVTGGPGPFDGEHAELPELPTLRCEGAATLPARPDRMPLVLPPARPGGAELACTVTLRGATARLTIRAAAPPPGLYVEAAPDGSAAGDAALRLRPFIVERGGVRWPTDARLAASVGSLARRPDGSFTLQLPPGAAPRTVAVAAWAADRAGAVFVPIAGHLELPVRTRRAVSVTVRLPGGTFGPVPVRRDRATVALVVPPGVARAVVRATDARGGASEEIVGLNPPPTARVAALAAAPEAPAGETRPIVVAVADTDGGPAPAGPAPRAAVERGRLGTARPRGPGLWELPYRAPGRLGPDRVTVTARGAPGVEVQLAVAPAAPHEVLVVLPPAALAPGAPLRAPLVIRDASRNLVTGRQPRATLEGRPVAVEPSGAGWTVVATLPRRVPPGGADLAVEVGAARARVRVPMRSAAAASASVAVAARDRTAELRLRVRDRHGNVVPADGYRVIVAGAQPGAARAAGEDLAIPLVADPDARAAQIEVLAGDASLARARVRFAPPPRALVLGAWAAGGMLSNLGDLTAGRGAAGVAIRRGVGPLELALSAGLEGFAWSDTTRLTAAGAERAVDRRLAVLGFPVALRARLALTRRLGVSAAAAFVPTVVHGTSDPHVQPADSFARTLVGVRGLCAGDVAVGPGRLQLAVGYGRARLSGGPITGNVDGLSFGLSYEVWLLDLGH
jgi:hypothetical protein